jgi:translation initiation factor IF-1
LGERLVEGTVVEALPSALYRVEIDGRHRITAHLGSGETKNFIRLVIGDRVVVEFTQRDLTRGRIVRKVTGHA